MAKKIKAERSSESPVYLMHDGARNRARARAAAALDWDSVEEIATRIRLHDQPDYVEQIDSLDERVESWGQQIARYHEIEKRCAFEVGKLYTQIKEAVPHGEFEKWCERLPYSKQARCAKMRVYERCLRCRELVPDLKDSVLEFACSKACPEPLTEHLFELGWAGSYRELRKLAIKVNRKGFDPNDPDLRVRVRKVAADVRWNRAAYAYDAARARFAKALAKLAEDLEVILENMGAVPEDDPRLARLVREHERAERWRDRLGT